MRADHYCNAPLRCPRCIWRFWKWAENYSRRFERPKGKRATARAEEVRATSATASPAEPASE